MLFEVVQGAEELLIKVELDHAVLHLENLFEDQKDFALVQACSFDEVLLKPGTDQLIVLLVVVGDPVAISSIEELLSSIVGDVRSVSDLVVQVILQ